MNRPSSIQRVLFARRQRNHGALRHNHRDIHAPRVHASATRSQYACYVAYAARFVASVKV